MKSKLSHSDRLPALLLIFALLLSLAACGSSSSGSEQTQAPATQNTSQDAPESTPAGTPESTPEGTPEIVLQFSHNQPPSSLSGTSLQYLGDAIGEESNGQIEVVVNPSGSLVTDAEALDAVMSGYVEMAQFQASVVTPTIKELTPFEIPGAYPGNKFEEFDEVTTPRVEEIFAKYGVKYLGPMGQSTAALVSKNNILKTPEDFVGLNVRTSGKWAGEAIKAWGGAPVTVPIGDLPTALERGTVDAAYTSWIATESFKLYESAPYVIFTSQQQTFVGIIMNLDCWEGLSDEQQDAINRGMDKFKVFGMDAIDGHLEEYLQTLKDANCTAYELTDEENAAFIDLTMPLLDQAAEIAGADGAALLEAFATLRNS